MEHDGCKKCWIRQEGPTIVEQICRQGDWALELPLDCDCGAEKTRSQRFFERAEACRVCRCQLPATPLKDYKHRIELAYFHQITVAFIARLSQVLHNTKALANDTLLLCELSQLRPKGDFGREFRNGPNRRCDHR